ncbi:PE-PPE domain-containing protein [Mycobacterium parmense]|uniref:Putative PPE family protein PPE28 n=1 Tax=Mycobacterium parmense TaxID=185642 RepID=A0A7I7YX56_9MYCO|nr:PE-PPE domain-containing protein [Mycobacterium parmense]MCV7350076.1 PE-PPE domain-containing protein [Mycobacterium parmense]ORW59344.1 hypothetical protein AWC20_10435 [Mycobacterium parmense]BBZ46390.1 putative PPE family protein PPE28 [Mycobacterium parmense]
MTTLITQPQLLTAAADDVSQINSVINQARTAAAGSTTNLVAAAEDEVSTVTAAFFGGFGQEYQALLQQATLFQEQFTAALAAAGNAYTAAEVEAQSALGIAPLANPVFGTYTPPTPNSIAVTANLIMTGSGTATPSSTYISNVVGRYLTQFMTTMNTPVSTAEGLYPFTGVKDLTLDISLARDVTELNNAITQQFTNFGGPISVLGYSQSSIVASMEMPILAAHGYTPSQIFFTLLGDPSAPNGGLFARFPGLSLPSLGVTFGTSTPADLFNTTIYTLEYDGFADFPQYPIDIFSDINALAGIVFVHGTYPTLSAAQLASGFLLPGSAGLGTVGSMTNYVMIPTANLPILDPLRLIPVVGNPLADLVQPDLTALVNWGYGNPAYGFSTGPANIQTPFGFLPPLADTLALGPALVSGTQAGVSAFANDISAMVPTALPSFSLPNLTLSSLTGALSGGAAGTGALALTSPASIQSTLTGLISGIQSANTNIVGTLTTDVTTAYATLLPTADIATAVVVSLPSYDVNLFLSGISQAINGDPVGGLINAFGDPIAANVGLTTLAGGFELINIENALDTIVTGNPNPGPF